jgi:hypothetical protein
MSTDSDPSPPSTTPAVSPTLQRRSRGFAFYLSAALCALFMVRILGADWNSHFTATWPDALFPKEGYVPVARIGPFHPGFYFAFRPIGYPAFLWAFGRSSHPTVVAQTALYCLSVMGLCITAWRLLRSRLVAGLTIALLIGVAVQPKFSLWNTQILSESISISIGFAAIAAWWRFAAEPTRKRAVWGWLFVIAWCLVRDSNVVAAVVVMVPAALLIAWRARGLESHVRRALVIGAAALVVTGGYSYLSQDISGRSSLQFQDLVGVRILPDAKLTNWFAGHGMPIDDALRARTGKAGFDDTFWRSKDPTFARYFKWSESSGRYTYSWSLFALESHYRAMFYRDLPTILKADMTYYDTHQVYGHLPHQMPLQLGGPSTRKGLTVWLLLAAVALAATAFASIRVRLRRRLYLGLVAFGGIGLALALAELFLSWFGEPLEIQRHAIGAICALAVLLVIVVATGVDAVVETIQTRDSGPTSDPSPTSASGREEPDSNEAEASVDA